MGRHIFPLDKTIKDMVWWRYNCNISIDSKYIEVATVLITTLFHPVIWKCNYKNKVELYNVDQVRSKHLKSYNVIHLYMALFYSLNIVLNYLNVY